MDNELNNTKYEYGCLGKKYFVSFYLDSAEKQESYGCTNKICGTIENFQPHGHTAIKDIQGNLWLIDSGLIAVMRPVNNIELRKWSVLSAKPIIYGQYQNYSDRIPCRRLFEVSNIFVVETDEKFVVIKNRRDTDLYTEDFSKVQSVDFKYNSDVSEFTRENILVCR